MMIDSTGKMRWFVAVWIGILVDDEANSRRNYSDYFAFAVTLAF